MTRTGRYTAADTPCARAVRAFKSLNAASSSGEGVGVESTCVANRTGLAPGKTPEAVEAGLDEVVPERFKHGAHHWLILHGRYVCKARHPDCPVCPVRDLCRFSEKTATAAGPADEQAADAGKIVVKADRNGRRRLRA